MLVLLRITIGWHFLYQGLAKLDDPDFSSAGFLSQSKGPLAGYYRRLLPDARQQLDPAPAPHENGALAAGPPIGNSKGPAERAVRRRAQFVERVDADLKAFQELYKPSPEQFARAEQFAAACRAQVDEFLDEIQPDIEKYLHEWQLLDAVRGLPSTDGQPIDKRATDEKAADKTTAVSPSVPFQQERIWKKQLELQGQAKTWLAELDRFHREFRQGLDGLLEQDQRARGPIKQPSKRIEQVDLAVSWGVAAIGACLLAGLFTRFSCLAGGLFLLSIVLAQPDWPGLYPPPHPSVGRSLFVNKEFVEMMALFALATTRVGRWGGLDFFVHYWFIRPLFGKRDVS
jgi:uncharacterized membrane protein YphA (DoxX/SURF4 family)